MLTREELLSRYEYDRGKGVFLRKHKWKDKPVGSVVGRLSEKGYVICNIHGKKYKVHRLIWLAEYGEFPRQQLDHKDGNKENNHISNLREVTDQQNQQNRKNAKGYYKTQYGFRVDLYNNNRCMYIGTFKTEAEAREAYVQAKIKYYDGYIHTTQESLDISHNTL